MCFLFLVTSFSSLADVLAKADLVIVYKSKATLELIKKGKVIKSYHIAMGDYPKNHKIKEGDERTPQGRYILDYKKSDSDFYRAIHISYPNDADILAANALNVSPGGQIMIHGQSPNSTISPREQQRYNWTNGCIAVTNSEMDEIWQLVDTGTPIELWP
ncbi:L,D-transpeptidase family protein [Parashewanella spongiae]|nr:L,D-transpeptidase family protein [Parashewanella spongiae]MCL1078271.1 L,D-transpeptidase family protein [Parashewanella spongiae]